MTLKDATEVDPGWVEIIPRNRVTAHVRTWLYSEQTETKNFSESLILERKAQQFVEIAKENLSYCKLT